MGTGAKHAIQPRWRTRGPFGFGIPEAGAMIGLGKDASYAAADKGEIPTIEIGQIRIVPAVPWLQKLGISDVNAIIEKFLAERNGEHLDNNNGTKKQRLGVGRAAAKDDDAAETPNTKPTKAKRRGSRAGQAQ
jgi:hypothetical protein